jgi:hypothetical protein
MMAQWPAVLIGLCSTCWVYGGSNWQLAALSSKLWLGAAKTKKA